MFKYDEYPEIKKIYQERERLLKKQRIAGKKYVLTTKPVKSLGAKCMLL